MSTALPPEAQPDLPLPRVQAIQRLANAVFWPFLIVFLVKLLSGLIVAGSGSSGESDGAARVPTTHPVDFALTILLVIAYLALAVGLTKACAAIGRKRSLVLGWFVALPAIVVLLSALSAHVYLGGFGGMIGFLLLNALLASPAFIWLSVRRDLEERFEEYSKIG